MSSATVTVRGVFDGRQYVRTEQGTGAYMRDKYRDRIKMLFDFLLEHRDFLVEHKMFNLDIWQMLDDSRMSEDVYRIPVPNDGEVLAQCGTICCIAGWGATIPAFQKQGFTNQYGGLKDEDDKPDPTKPSVVRLPKPQRLANGIRYKLPDGSYVTDFTACSAFFGLSTALARKVFSGDGYPGPHANDDPIFAVQMLSTILLLDGSGMLSDYALIPEANEMFELQDDDDDADDDDADDDEDEDEDEYEDEDEDDDF